VAAPPDGNGRFAPAFGVEVVDVFADTAARTEFQRFPGAHDVVVTPIDSACAWPAVDTTWWLVSPSGHRVEAVNVRAERPGPSTRGTIHLAVGDRDSWLVHAGHGWLLEPSEPDDDAGVEGLLVRMTEPTRGRDGVTLYFAVDQTWAPLVRGAQQLMLADVPGRPTGLVERCVETAGTGEVPQMMVDVHLGVDPVLAVGAVYRLQPRVEPALRLAR